MAAAAAMVHFFEPEDLPSFEGRLQPILERLVTTLQRGPLYVQEEVLATIGEPGVNSTNVQRLWQASRGQRSDRSTVRTERSHSHQGKSWTSTSRCLDQIPTPPRRH